MSEDARNVDVSLSQTEGIVQRDAGNTATVSPKFDANVSADSPGAGDSTAGADSIVVADAGGATASTAGAGSPIEDCSDQNLTKDSTKTSPRVTPDSGKTADKNKLSPELDDDDLFGPKTVDIDDLFAPGKKEERKEGNGSSLNQEGSLNQGGSPSSPPKQKSPSDSSPKDSLPNQNKSPSSPKSDLKSTNPFDVVPNTTDPFWDFEPTNMDVFTNNAFGSNGATFDAFGKDTAFDALGKHAAFDAFGKDTAFDAFGNDAFAKGDDFGPQKAVNFGSTNPFDSGFPNVKNGFPNFNNSDLGFPPPPPFIADFDSFGNNNNFNNFPTQNTGWADFNPFGNLQENQTSFDFGLGRYQMNLASEAQKHIKPLSSSMFERINCGNDTPTTPSEPSCSTKSDFQSSPDDITPSKSSLENEGPGNEETLLSTQSIENEGSEPSKEPIESRLSTGSDEATSPTQSNEVSTSPTVLCKESDSVTGDQDASEEDETGSPDRPGNRSEDLVEMSSPRPALVPRDVDFRLVSDKSSTETQKQKESRIAREWTLYATDPLPEVECDAMIKAEMLAVHGNFLLREFIFQLHTIASPKNEQAEDLEKPDATPKGVVPDVEPQQKPNQESSTSDEGGELSQDSQTQEPDSPTKDGPPTSPTGTDKSSETVKDSPIDPNDSDDEQDGIEFGFRTSMQEERNFRINSRFTLRTAEGMVISPQRKIQTAPLKGGDRITLYCGTTWDGSEVICLMVNGFVRRLWYLELDDISSSTFTPFISLLDRKFRVEILTKSGKKPSPKEKSKPKIAPGDDQPSLLGVVTFEGRTAVIRPDGHTLLDIESHESYDGVVSFVNSVKQS